MSQLLGGGAYPAFNRVYPDGFRRCGLQGHAARPAERPGLADPGANRQIQHVGISNFRLPIRYHTRDNGDLTLETSVTGTVSLEAEKKGINMSRIMRSFYAHAEKTFSFEVIEAALDDYKADLESFDARIQMRLSFPMKVESLRSGLSGYQYYDIALELVERGRRAPEDRASRFRLFLDLPLFAGTERTRARDAQPAGHAAFAALGGADLGRTGRGAGLPVVRGPDRDGRAAVPTETQVMVKREDEQAFAELNAANPIFVEDAARLFAEQLQNDPRVGDFRVVASHQESLHSHDAVSVLTEGETFAAGQPRSASLPVADPRGLTHGRDTRRETPLQSGVSRAALAA
jgi:GTP cyclohydrolase I